MGLTAQQTDALLAPIKPHRVLKTQGQSHVAAFDVTATPPSTNRRLRDRRAHSIVGVLLVAVSMRPALASVGPCVAALLVLAVGTVRRALGV